MSTTQRLYWLVRFAPGSDTVLGCRCIVDEGAPSADCVVVEATNAIDARAAAKAERAKEAA